MSELEQKIKEATPESITDMDNPIFVMEKDTKVIFIDLDNERYVPNVQILKGTRLRLLGCNLAADASPFRLGDGRGYVILDNTLVSYTGDGGALGIRYDGEYEEINA